VTIINVASIFLRQKDGRMRIKTGFTLIEILVVISIIGILMAVGAVAFSNAQVSARDARRKADMKAIQAAQEQFYMQNASAYAVIGTAAGVSPCSPTAALTNIAPFPTDPKNTGTSTYFCATAALGASYCSCALMENVTAGNSGAGNATCSNIGSGTTHFCVKNQQ
jgi:prepilin-type N-terminal cleavage/methylation domain-containing protein